MDTQTNIFDLDQFVIYNIISYLDYDSYLSLLCTCKILYQLLNDLIFLYNNKNELMWKNINKIEDDELKQILVNSCDDYSTRYICKMFNKYAYRSSMIALKIKFEMTNTSKYDLILEPFVETDILDELIYSSSRTKKFDRKELQKILSFYIPADVFLIDCLRIGCSIMNTEYVKIIKNVVCVNYPDAKMDMCQSCGCFISGH